MTRIAKPIHPYACPKGKDHRFSIFGPPVTFRRVTLHGKCFLCGLEVKVHVRGARKPPGHRIKPVSNLVLPLTND